LAGYPQAPYTNKYYVDEMKKVFGVDVSRIQYNSTLEPKTEEAFLKAWDYFKEKSKELDE
jgi:hypothetical protein